MWTGTGWTRTAISDAAILCKHTHLADIWKGSVPRGFSRNVPRKETEITEPWRRRFGMDVQTMRRRPEHPDDLLMDF